MANAVVGRVLLIPKGNYSASVSYNMLDLVRHDNKSWVCKQACTGQTPQEGDYWQLMASDGAEGGYCYIRYSVNADGTDFVAVPTEQTKYVGFYTGDSETAPTEKTSYAWSKYVGEDGTIGVDGERGTRINQGTAITGVSTTPIPFPTGITDSLIGDEYQNTTTWNVYRCTTGGDAATALWIYVGNIKGADGLGSGDMIKSVYDTNNSGVVDMAEKLQTARTIELTGSVTGSAEFDGSGNVQINTTGGGASAWDDVEDKPFNTIGSNGLIVNTDVLDVDLLKIERKASTLTSKAAVVLADEMVIADSADSSITKRSPFSALKTLFDTLYNNYILPTATTSVKGGIKIGNGLEMDGETLNTTGSGGGTVINDPTTTPATPLETTNVLDDITSIMNNTSANQLVGALALKEVNSNLGDGQIAFEVVDGEPYVKVGADPARPFSGESKCREIYIDANRTMTNGTGYEIIDTNNSKYTVPVRTGWLGVVAIINCSTEENIVNINFTSNNTTLSLSTLPCTHITVTDFYTYGNAPIVAKSDSDETVDITGLGDFTFITPFTSLTFYSEAKTYIYGNAKVRFTFS